MTPLQDSGAAISGDRASEKLFLGILFVFLGIFLLAKNTGLIPSEWIFPFWKIWPVFLVYVGLANLKIHGILGILLGIAVSFLVAGLIGLFFLTAS